MASLEVYEKLRKEINCLIGDQLLDDDEFFLDLISTSKDSKRVFDLAKEMKENGNTLFKQGEIDDALEQYGYAAMILARYQFEQYDDRSDFFRLAICILMNSAVCFSKKKEFLQVGRICTIVLDFDPHNVKAMFRRAMAAVELGKKDLAKLDLLMAANLDPNNKEVLKKLEELKNTTPHEVSDNQKSDDTPLGLGLGLSPPKKKSKLELEQNKFKEAQEVQQNTQAMVSSGIIAQSENRVNPIEETIEAQYKPTGNELKVSEASMEMEYMTENAKKDMNVQSKTNDVGDISRNQSVNQAEPRVRFVNRRRPGSSISISRKDYQQLLKGNTIHCVNSRIGSPMAIRLVNDVDLLKRKGMSQEVHKTDSNIADQSKIINSNSSQGKDDSALDVTLDPMENDVKAEAESEEGGSQHIDCFNFTSVSNNTLEQTSKKAARKRLREAQYKARNARKKQVSTATFTHLFFECRNQLGTKRKPVQLCDSDHRPRKQPLLESSCSFKPCYSIESVNTIPRSCTTNYPCSNVSCMSMNCRVAVDDTQELVAAVRKE